MKLDKYDWKFIRMMAKMFLTIVALVIILVLVGIPLLFVKLTLGIMLVISFVVKQVYWNYLLRLELNEKMDEVIQG